MHAAFEGCCYIGTFIDMTPTEAAAFLIPRYKLIPLLIISKHLLRVAVDPVLAVDTGRISELNLGHHEEIWS